MMRQFISTVILIGALESAGFAQESPGFRAPGAGFAAPAAAFVVFSGLDLRSTGTGLRMGATEASPIFGREDGSARVAGNVGLAAAVFTSALLLETAPSTCRFARLSCRSWARIGLYAAAAVRFGAYLHNRSVIADLRRQP